MGQVHSDDGGLAVEVEDAVGDGSVVLPEVEAVEDAVEDAVGQPVVEPDSQPDHDDDEGIAIVDLVESQGPGPDDGGSDGQELCVGICHCGTDDDDTSTSEAEDCDVSQMDIAQLLAFQTASIQAAQLSLQQAGFAAKEMKRKTNMTKDAEAQRRVKAAKRSAKARAKRSAKAASASELAQVGPELHDDNDTLSPNPANDHDNDAAAEEGAGEDGARIEWFRDQKGIGSECFRKFGGEN